MKNPTATKVYEADFCSFQSLLNAAIFPDGYNSGTYKIMWANIIQITSKRGDDASIERGLDFESFCGLVSEFDLLLLMTVDVFPR